MNRFSIKDIENLTGIKAHTIRIWEQRYGILQPRRTATNIRYYDGEDLKLALRIALLNSFGYKISRIQQMTDRDMNALIQKVADKGFQLQSLVNNLLEATLSMDGARLEALLDAQVKQYGLEQTIELLVFKFLEKVGMMWLTNRLVIAQEHLASNIIARKLHVAIDALPLPHSDPAGDVSQHSFLLFLPEGEIHEISLLYVQYLLRRQGKNVTYLGANTPLKDARLAWEAARQTHVFLHLTSFNKEAALHRYLGQASEAFPTATIFVSGAALRFGPPAGLPNVRYLYSLQEAKTEFSEA